MSLRLLIGILFTACATCFSYSDDKLSSKENANLPYNTVVELLSIPSIDQGTRTLMKGRVVSTNTNIAPTDIKLHIASSQEVIIVPLDKDGVFALPFREELIRENPMIVANQPKGTLNLEAQLDFKQNVRFQGNMLRYQELMSSVHSMNNKLDLLESATANPRENPSMMFALKLTFDKITPDARVIIKGKDKEHPIKLNSKREIILPDVNSLFIENPLVEFPSQAFSGALIKIPKPRNWKTL